MRYIARPLCPYLCLLVQPSSRVMLGLQVLHERRRDDVRARCARSMTDLSVHYGLGLPCGIAAPAGYPALCQAQRSLGIS